MSEELVELLYVDLARLESYHQQLRARPKHVPTFSASIGLAGPQVGATWSALDSASALVPRIEEVRECLARRGILSCSRPSEQDRWDLGRPLEELPEAAQADLWAIFREEVVELRTVVLEPRLSDPFLKNGLVLWIAVEEAAEHLRPDVLLLIQQFPLDDEPFARTVSGFSLLAREADKLALPTVPGIGANPIEALKLLGAWVGPPKLCSALYRVRATFAEPQRQYSLTTVGYPIVIARS